MEEQFIELIGEFERDKWYIIRPTIKCRSSTLEELTDIFRRNKPEGDGGILVLSDYLNIQGVEAYTICSTLRTFRINIDILHALYRQIKWRPLSRLKGALQKLAIRKRLRHWWRTRPIYANWIIGWALTGHSYRATLRYVGKQYRKKIKYALQNLDFRI